MSFDCFLDFKIEIMPKINVQLREYTTAPQGVVWVQFYLNREKVQISTKVHVGTRDWDSRKLHVKDSDIYASDKNLIIGNILARVNDVLVKARLRNKMLTRQSFLKAYNRPSDYDTFFQFYDAKMRIMSRVMEEGTYRVHESVVNKIRLKWPKLHFDDIDRNFLAEYYTYLRKDLNNNDNTAQKNMQVFKKYVRLAYKDGYMDSNPFDDWRIRKTTASCVYLTEEELTKLITIYRSGELEYPLHITLQFFLFLCFSSLHVGDARCLRLEQFGQDSFTYFRKKLRNSKPEPIVVPYSEPLRTLLYNIVGTRRKGPLFTDLQTDQAMNRNLKEIAFIAGIDKPITHKVGRHTFATIFLRKTKDITALKEILGHSDISETLVYAHVMDDAKQEGIQCFNAFELT